MLQFSFFRGFVCFSENYQSKMSGFMRLCQVIFLVSLCQETGMAKSLSPTDTFTNVYRLRNTSSGLARNGGRSTSCSTTADCVQSKCCLNGQCRNKGRAFDKCYAALENNKNPSQQEILVDLCPCHFPYTCLSFNREQQARPQFGSIGFCIPPLW